MACLVVGMFPAKTVGPYLDVAAVPVLGAEMPFHNLTVWHGLNLPLVMSLAAMMGGIMSVSGAGKIPAGHNLVPVDQPFDGKHIFEFFLGRLDALARRLMQWLSTERLQVQLLLLICAVFASALIPLSNGGLPAGNKLMAAADPAFALMWLVGGVCAIGAATQAKYHRLAALSLAGAAGLATCMTFVWFSAPDLALTQLIVEVVTLVLLLLGLRWLPPRYKWLDDKTVPLRARIRARTRRLRDLGPGNCCRRRHGRIELLRC